jgi:putative spermidine/putrescine transport system permease protein
MTPGFLVGLGNQLLWKAMNRTPSLWQTALGANVIWGIPFAFLVMLAVWNRYDKRVEEAARDLGADQKRTFREVTLPLVWTGIFGSFLFGFTLTWNDYDRTILLQNGYETQTLPLQIGGMTFSAAIRPDLYALGAATTAISLLVIGLLLLVVWLRLRFRGAPVHRAAEEFGDTTGLARVGSLGARTESDEGK